MNLDWALGVKYPWELTRSELQYMTKPILLTYFSRTIHMLYDRLPDNLRADSGLYRIYRVWSIGMSLIS